MALGADGALGLVGGVEGELGEDGVVDLVGLAPHEREQRAALQPVRRRDARQLAQRREDVDLRDERLGDLAAVEAAGAAHDQHHAEPAVGQRRLGAREREPVVGGEDHDRVVGELVLVERVEHRADAVVERARARLVGGHVAPRLGRVGQVGGRQRVERVAHRGRLEVLAVGLEEPDREEERLRRALGDQAQRGRARPRRRGGCRCRRRGRSRARRGRARGAARRPARSSSRRRAACGRCGGRSRVSSKPRWASPIIPLECAHWPVSRHARLPEQVGAAQNAWRNSRPWSASRWMFGVGTGCPYGCT